MTIEQIDSERILIALCDEDMRAFSLEFESMTLSDPHVRKIIKKLLSLASTETGISVKNKKLLIEAMPYINGCLFLITLSGAKAHKRKIYKIKAVSPTLIRFSETEDMLKCMAFMYRAGVRGLRSDLYSLSSEYFLVIKSVMRPPKRLEALLCEYGEKVHGGSLAISRLGEYGKALAQNNAIDLIGSALSETKKKRRRSSVSD